MTDETRLAYRRQASAWAEGLAGETGWVALDTETTGLSGTVDFVQMAVVEHVLGEDGGVTLLDTLVKPAVPIEPGARAVHGLAEEDLRDAPTFPEVHQEIVRALAGRRVVAYNSAFDRRVYEGLLLRHRLEDAPPHPDADPSHPWECAAFWYGRFLAVPHPTGKRRFKRHRLPGGDHTALGDARATLGLVLRMGLPDDVPSLDTPASLTRKDARA